MLDLAHFVFSHAMLCSFKEYKVSVSTASEKNNGAAVGNRKPERVHARSDLADQGGSQVMEYIPMLLYCLVWELLSGISVWTRGKRNCTTTLQ